LTNSLEESHPDTGTLFANWLSSEANEANFIKRDTPVMCIVGNPPYSGESNNKGEWIMKLMEDYKKEPGGKEKLKERNPKAINDDYVKFLRYGQHYIERNGSGILAFINPHGFLDNATYRGMRWNLLKTYDKIYTIDLHGNGKKKETSPDGSADVNVFDIMQGVAITIFVKTGKKKANELGKVFHYDLYGKREFKYDFLSKNSLKTISYDELPNVAPNYFFVNKNFDEQNSYNRGFSLNELFVAFGMGITTGNDKELIGFNANEICNRFTEYNLKKVNYRLFDYRYVNYDSKLIDRAREKLMSNFIDKDNLGLISLKSVRNDLLSKVGITKLMIDKSAISTLDNGFVFPLYLYPEANGQLSTEQITTPPFGHPSKGEFRIPNLNLEIVNKIAKQLGLTFVPEKELEGNVCMANNDEVRPEFRQTLAPIDVLDYIYAVLHSRT
jgi:predicted helicase